MATNSLKDIIVKEGITQGELAVKSGVSVTSINRFANKQRTPSPTTANKILKALNGFQGIGKQYELGELFPAIKLG
jgi:transcriptional regulator with XRE-family HTH domain